MTPAELLTDAFERVLQGGLAAIDGLSEEQLTHQPAPGANSIVWLVWHATRVQDDHVADVAGLQQVWAARGFLDAFDLPLDADDTGFGHTAEQVAKVRASSDLLADYLRATHEQTIAYVGGLGPEHLDKIIDTNWDPPVILGARLVSVVNDDIQHVGQAAYVRGLL